MKKNKTRQFGIGLLELMLSLAIIAVLLVMATRYYMTAGQSSRINQAVDAYGGLAAAAASWAQSNGGSYSNLDLTTADSNGWIPHSLVKDKNDLNTPWGPQKFTSSPSDVIIDNFLAGVTSEKEKTDLKSKLCGAADTSGNTAYSVVTQTCVAGPSP
jgi:type II secretory pathway pseudopilin PulG